MFGAGGHYRVVPIVGFSYVPMKKSRLIVFKTRLKSAVSADATEFIMPNRSPKSVRRLTAARLGSLGK